ncbi:unnamed protein product [Paramecium sonneborni]|uniref:Uncharacterized protein n=1 Tax=Paramecium sonneborni TaxID=65129 RepID=A0A8S1RMD4_9CILI|nr:unnamed protein product [Paramecium sonneborni]
MQRFKIQFCYNVLLIQSNTQIVKKYLIGFGQILNLITKSKENLNNLADQLNKSFAQVNTKFEEYQKEIEKMNKQLIKISESIFLNLFHYKLKAFYKSIYQLNQCQRA